MAMAIVPPERGAVLVPLEATWTRAGGPWGGACGGACCDLILSALGFWGRLVSPRVGAQESPRCASQKALIDAGVLSWRPVGPTAEGVIRDVGQAQMALFDDVRLREPNVDWGVAMLPETEMFEKENDGFGRTSIAIEIGGALSVPLATTPVDLALEFAATHGGMNDALRQRLDGFRAVVGTHHDDPDAIMDAFSGVGDAVREVNEALKDAGIACRPATLEIFADGPPRRAGGSGWHLNGENVAVTAAGDDPLLCRLEVIDDAVPRDLCRHLFMLT